MVPKGRWVLAVAGVLCAGLALAQTPKFSYPAARTAEVTEELFGVKVSDPYRWMEVVRGSNQICSRIQAAVLTAPPKL